MKRLVFVLLLTAIGIFASFVDAFYGLLLYTWYSFSSPLELTYGSLEGSRLSLIVGAIVVSTTFHQRRALFVKHIITALCICFILSCLCSLAYSMKYEAKYIFGEVENISKIIIMATLAPVLLTSLKNLRWFIFVIAVSAGLLGAYYGTFGLLAGSRSIEGPGRIGDNNGYAIFLVTSLPIIFYAGRYALFIKDSFFRGLATAALVGGNVLAIVLTFSRGGFLALSLVLSLILLNVRQPIFKALSWGLLIPTFVFVIWQIFAVNNELMEIPTGASDNSTVQETISSYVGRLRTLKHHHSEVSSASSRTHFWKVALAMFQDKPMLGVGFGRYQGEYQNYDFEKGKFGLVRSVHNVFLMVLSETGIIGFGTFILIIITSLMAQQKTRSICKLHPGHQDSKELRDYARMCQLALLGYCTGSCFVNTLTHETFWAIISISIALEILARNIREEELAALSLRTKKGSLFSQ